MPFFNSEIFVQERAKAYVIFANKHCSKLRVKYIPDFATKHAVDYP